MITLEEYMSIHIMHKQGYSKKRIARELKISINTVRKHLKSKQVPNYGKRPKKPLKLDPYKSYIKKRLQIAHPNWIPATVIYQEITQQGYTGGLTLLRQFMSKQRPQAKQQPICRFETEPGKQAQVDWAEFRRGKKRIAAFVMTLGYSRFSYVEFVNNEKINTLIACHEKAFDYLGGVPKNILYDNMKTVVIERNTYGPGKHRFHAKFWDFSKHSGFLPKLCQPYRPQTKGKVERFIHYLRYSFYYPLESLCKQIGIELEIDMLNQKVLEWLQLTANKRIHGTTGATPLSLLPEEQNALQDLVPRYILGHDQKAKKEEKHLKFYDQLSTDSLQPDLKIYEDFIETGD